MGSFARAAHSLMWSNYVAIINGLYGWAGDVFRPCLSVVGDCFLFNNIIIYLTMLMAFAIISGDIK